MATPAHIVEQMRTLAEAKSRELLSRAQTVLRRYQNSGELIDSLQVRVEPPTETEAGKIILEFAEHGKFLDKRTMVWGKVPKINKMEKWVRQRGTSSFRYVSGINDASRLSEEQKVKKIASGVAWAYREHQTRWKRRAWRRATLVDLLIDLNEQSAEIWANAIVVDLKDAIENG